MPNYLQEICKNCGSTYGSHHGGTSPYPRDYCPGHEGGMDWEEGPGTIFKPTGTYKEEEPNDLSNSTSYNLGHSRFIQIR